MDLRVDTDGLVADGIALSQSAAPQSAAPRCDPPASDPVSVSVAEVLTRWSHALWTLMEHAGQQREVGGLSVARTGSYLSAVDEAGAAGIAAAGSGGSVDSTAPQPSSASLPAVLAPTLPPIPQMPSMPVLTGDQVSTMVHSGPGPDRLRAFAQQWRHNVAPHILSTADQTRSYGNSIEQNWDDGDPQAAKNVLKHADWLESSLHASALRLADSADTAASHAETLIHNTPRPEELRDIKARLNTALANYRASDGLNGGEVIALNNELGEKHATAVTHYGTYAAAAPSTTDGAGQPPAPAPPIVRGDLGAAAAGPQGNYLNPGANRGESDDGNDQSSRSGNDPLKPSTADVGPPLGSAGVPPIGPAQPPPVAPPGADPTATGTAANVAGTIMGAGIGAASQLGNSLPGLSGGGSPLSGLSSLSSLPQLAEMPNMGAPQAPSGPGDGDSMPDLGGSNDFGSDGTSPAGGGVGAGGGGGAPIPTSSPAVSAATSAAAPMLGASPGSAVPSGPAAAGGSGMFMPPMMGGLGGDNDDGRKSRRNRRVIARPVPNTEPVFGEVQRTRATRRAKPQAKEESR